MVMDKSSNLYWDSDEANNLAKYTDSQLDNDSAKPGDVVKDYLYKDSLTRETLIGTMPIISNGRIEIRPGEEYNIPKGYHDGTEYLYCGPLSDYTYGTATPEVLANNYTAWVNGVRIVGTLDLDENDQVGDATPEDIAAGKIAWVNRKQVVGTVPVNPRQDINLSPGESYTIPNGIHNGSSVISVFPLEEFTPGTATSDKILLGDTAWVDGVLITGTFDINEYIANEFADTDTLQEHVREGYRFYSAKLGVVGTGTMKDYLNIPELELKNDESFTIPEGYHDGTAIVSAISLKDATPATAIAEKILENETAWVNGVKITGTMHQYITDATDTTAKPWDIKDGKTAYIDGYKAIGTNKNDLVSWNSVDTTTQDDTPIAIALPIDNWQSVYYMRLDIHDENNNIIQSFFKENYGSGEHLEFDDGNIVIESEYGKNIINISDTLNREMTIYTIGYTIIENYEEEETP